jgi:hypothetical protein
MAGQRCPYSSRCSAIFARNSAGAVALSVGMIEADLSGEVVDPLSGAVAYPDRRT